MKEWTSGRVVTILVVTCGLLVGTRSRATRPDQKSCTSHLSESFLASESLFIQWY